MEDADLLRGLTALGHGAALQARGETEEDLAWELRRAGELLWQAACCPLELVWYEGREDIDGILEDMGCLRVRAGLDWRKNGLRGSVQAESLLWAAGQRREDLAVYLGRAGDCTGGLGILVESLSEAGYRMCPYRA